MSNTRIVLQDIQSALAQCRDERHEAEIQTQQAQAQEARARRDLETQLSRLQQEAAARDAAAQLSQQQLQKSAAAQAGQLREALANVSRLNELCATAQAAAKSADESRNQAVIDASEAEAKYERAVHKLQRADGEKQAMKANLAEMRLALERSQGELQTSVEAQAYAESSYRQSSTRLEEVVLALEQSQEEVRKAREAQALTETINQQASEKLAELDRLVQETQARNSELDCELQASLGQVAALTHAADGLKAEIVAAATRTAELQASVVLRQANARKLAAAEAHATAQATAMRESIERVAELERDLHSMEAQLRGELHGVVEDCLFVARSCCA